MEKSMIKGIVIGMAAVVRTTFRPGATLPVKDGQVVLTPPVIQ